MHNCKATRETLIALVLNAGEANQGQPLPVEVTACAVCLEEHASLSNTLRVARETKESALPGDDFWPGYQARLRQSLVNGATRSATDGMRAHNEPRRLKTRLSELFTSSVRIPVPVAAALLIFLGVSFAFAINSRRRVSPPAPIVVTKTIEVPVLQEKPVDRIVNRIVYRDRVHRRPSGEANTIARQSSTSPAEEPLNLIGFKPANEVNLTIIKGSQR